MSLMNGVRPYSLHFLGVYFRCVFMRLVQAATAFKSTDCYLGLLYVEDVAVYGYMTPLKVKIIIALELSDSIVRDADVVTMFKALHTAYRLSVGNPFLRLNVPTENITDHATVVSAGSPQWKAFRERVEEIARLVSGSTAMT
ncbi:hypothetical protein QCA50_005280 [Cerrena zonata]|uniref:Uncharacterized protein n=1 Tax=Cerrena zonata TaxID=2478898 RepID=A0AAW0GQN9_9APHY